MAYVEDEVYQFLMDVLRPTRTNYKSDHQDFIRNEVLGEIKGIISSCIQPKGK